MELFRDVRNTFLGEGTLFRDVRNTFLGEGKRKNSGNTHNRVVCKVWMHDMM